MFKFKDARNRTTLIYITSSIVVLLFGIFMAFWGDTKVSIETTDKNLTQKSIMLFSIGTSLFAAGLASLGFAVIRVFDDQDSVQMHENIEKIETEITETRRAIRSSRKIQGAEERCLFDSQISDRFKSAIRDVPRKQSLDIKLVGFTLIRFFNDQFELLVNESKTRDVVVRMLLQYPEGHEFLSQCKIEARNENVAKDNVVAAMQRLKGARELDLDLIYSTNKLRIYVRFYEQFQPVTFFGVNDTILVRPRIKSTGAGVRFYEEYYRNKDHSAPHFDLFIDHFNDCWSKSSFRLPKDISSRIGDIFIKQ
jgi:very-short-patch-repair endonuclease